MKNENVENDLISHSRAKRQQLQNRTVNAEVEPTPLHGSLPDPADGWCLVRSEDPTLYIAGLKIVPMTDGTTRRYAQVLVKPAEVRRMRTRAKRLAKRIAADDRKAAKKAATRTVREFLFRTGKLS